MSTTTTATAMTTITAPPSVNVSTTRTNRACVWVGKHTIEIQVRAVKPLGPNDVLVQVICTGICGSDVHNWNSALVSRQLVMGHESAGVIVEVGDNVSQTRIGERVGVEPGFACMKYVSFSPSCR
jgi:D-xylulose reductase